MRLLYLIFVVIIFVNCGKSKRISISEKNENEIAQINKIQIDYSFLDSIEIEKNDYQLHPYSGYPIFSIKNSKYQLYITAFGKDEKYSIDIVGIEKQKDGFLSKVEFKNILLDGEYTYGVKIENISYLTVEEQLIQGRNISHT